MAVNAKFQADFTSFYDALQKADVQLKGFETGAANVERQLTRMSNSFSGVKIIQDAHTMTAAMLEAGGTTALTEKELRKLDSTVSEASEKMRRLGLEVPPGFQKIHEAAEDATQSNKTWADSFVTVSGVIQGLLALRVVQWVKESITATLDYADQLENLSVATGVSLQELQGLEAIGVRNKVSMELLARAVEVLNKRIDDPAGRRALEDMRLSYDRIRALNVGDRFLEIASAIAKIQDPTDKANAGAALFDRTWNQISPAIQGNLKEIANSVNKLSDSQIHDIDQLGDAWDSLTLAAKRYGAAVLAMGVPKGASPFISSALAGGIFDPTLNGAIPNVAGHSVSQHPLASLQAPDDLGSVLIGGKTLEQQQAANDEAVRGVNEAKQAAREWNAALADIRDNWKVIFATIEHLKPLEVTTFQALSLATPGAGLAHLLPNFSMQDRNLGFGPADIASAARANIEAATKGVFDGVGNAVPQAIIASFEGGGSAAKAAAGTIGVHIGQNVVDKFGSAITGTLGKTFGGAINAVLPGIGALAGPLVGLVGKIFGPSEESAKVSPLRDEFFKMAGGLETLNPKVQELTGSLTLVDDVFKAKTVDQYNASIEKLTGLLDFQDKAMQTLTATAQKYGFTLEELGPAFERQQLDKKAQELYQDWQVLASGGVDIDNIARRMGDSINQFVGNALAMGTEVPEAMRPMLEKMAQMGLLTDASGNKIDDLSEAGINFTLTMSDGFKALIAEVQKLTDAISRGLGLAIQNLPDKTVTIHAKYDLPPEINQDFDSSLQGFATGTRGRLLNFGAGTAVRLHGFEQVRTASEVQSDAAHLQAIKAEIVGLRNDMQDLPRQIIYAGQVA